MDTSPINDQETFPAGGETAFKVLFETHYPLVYRRIFMLTHSHEDAEELAHDIFLRLWQRRADLTRPDSWDAYLSRAATYKALDSLRRRKVVLTDVDPAAEHRADDTAADTPLLVRDLEKRLLAALEALPPQCRQVFMLSRFEGLSYQQIAATLDISPKTVENHIGRALYRLRDQL
jgi:RNA polymerase sigma-70 factor (ECF subfamily)